MLLSAIARSAPSTPDMKRLKRIIEASDERTGGCQASCHPSTSIYKVYPVPTRTRAHIRYRVICSFRNTAPAITPKMGVKKVNEASLDTA